MPMTADEILEELRGIVAKAEGRDLTEDEANRYEELENSLKVVNRSNGIRQRQVAYETPVPGNLAAVVHTSVPKSDNTLDRAFTNYLRTGIPNQDIAGLRAEVDPRELRNEQSAGVSAAGGYTVPPGFRQKLVEVRKAFGGLAAVVDSFDTDTGAPIEYPSLDDTANQGDITAEGAAVASGADMAFGSVPLGAYKYTSAGTGSNLPLRVSVELLQDSAFDIDALVARVLGTRIQRKQAAHWTTGTGVGQPLGLVASSLTDDVQLDTPDTPVYKDLVDTEDALDPEYEQNAMWIMKKNTWSQLRLIVDTAGRPILQSQNDGITGQPQRTLLGYPVVIDQGMPTLSSAADTFPVAFGDFREAYVIRRVSNLAIVVDPYTRAVNGQVQYHGWERADGNIQNRSAYKILMNNT